MKNHSLLDDLTDQTFGKLKVVEFAYTDKGLRFWKCLCSCGKEHFVHTGRLRSGNTQSCGHTRKKAKEKSALNVLYRNYKNTATHAERKFELNIDIFRQLIKQKCYYCGIEPNKFYHPKGCQEGFYCHGIDRIRNNEGYTLNNVVTCCKECNYSKHTKSQEEFFEQIKRIYLKHFKKD